MSKQLQSSIENTNNATLSEQFQSHIEKQIIFTLSETVPKSNKNK